MGSHRHIHSAAPVFKEVWFECVFAHIIIYISAPVYEHICLVRSYVDAVSLSHIDKYKIILSYGADYTTPLWWCLSLGACLGGNMTMIGAAANVIVSESAAKEGHPMFFLRFMKYGVIVVAISLIISSLYINLRYM